MVGNGSYRSPDRLIDTRQDGDYLSAISGHIGSDIITINQAVETKTNVGQETAPYPPSTTIRSKSQMRERAATGGGANLSTQMEAKLQLMKSLSNFSSKRLQQEFVLGSSGVFDAITSAVHDPAGIRNSQLR